MYVSEATNFQFRLILFISIPKLLYKVYEKLIIYIDVLHLSLGFIMRKDTFQDINA